MLPFFLATTLAQPDLSDPYNLPIGTPGQVTLSPGFTETRTGRQATPAQIAAAADNLRFVIVGEQHGTPSHHQAQAEIVQALLDRGRFVVVGMEMFTRDRQKNVNRLSTGQDTIEQFETSSDWKTQWGHNFAAYRPLLQTIRENRLRIVALNVPRDWVRQASRQGFDSFSEFQRSWVPSLDLTNQNHKMVFQSLMGGHPLENTPGRNIYAGQVTWDVGMAQTALEWSRQWPNPRWIMVIATGAGHTMYKQGIDYRLHQIARPCDQPRSINIVCVTGRSGQPVARGLAYYVFSPD